MTKIVAIDTEFERKRTYIPILSIVQLKEEGKKTKIYDVYNVDDEKLVDLLEILINDDIVKVIHSARQDIEAIYYRFNIPIKNIFDTQIGYKYIKNSKKNEIGYAKLVKEFCDIDIQKDKKIQNSNWMQRPLTDKQIEYAKQDVEYLHDIYNKMTLKFNDIYFKDKYKNFLFDCKKLENEKNYIYNPKLFWKKIKNKFILKPNYLLIKQLFILREKLAFKINIPREFVIKLNNLINYANTGDKNYLITHYKVNKLYFIKVYNNFLKQK